MQRTPSDDGHRYELSTLENTPPWEWPEDTDEKLLEILRNDGTPESDRLIAADLAGDFTVINDALAGELLSILRGATESDALRSTAAISLGPVLEYVVAEGFDDPDAVPITKETFDTIRAALRELYRDTAISKTVRRRILEASVRAAEDWHEEAILAASASDDPEWRHTAVLCMGHVRGFDRHIVEALASTDPDIQFEAVRAAGNWEVTAAGPRIIQLISSKDTDKTLLLAAIEAAGYICPMEAQEILSNLSRSKDEDIAEAAADALLAANEFDDGDDAEEDGDNDEEEFTH